MAPLQPIDVKEPGDDEPLLRRSQNFPAYKTLAEEDIALWTIADEQQEITRNTIANKENNVYKVDGKNY
ncbi:hypothetical protein CEXT_629881 [Caerostris extrusa]|uniref:Uncharacterized protein n=1 Tax=Caerostris extrusa TaxID=172846 RepID=A0AAV4XVS7_CAEEX|nr:hypothetical protein CEXT_629881 [Caerostris extrusa]